MKVSETIKSGKERQYSIWSQWKEQFWQLLQLITQLSTFFNALQMLWIQCHVCKTMVLKFCILPSVCDFQYFRNSLIQKLQRAISEELWGLHSLVLKTHMHLKYLWS